MELEDGFGFNGRPGNRTSCPLPAPISLSDESGTGGDLPGWDLVDGPVVVTMAGTLLVNVMRVLPRSTLLLERESCSVCPELVKSLGGVIPVPDMSAHNSTFH